jgi:hypothetical protein
MTSTANSIQAVARQLGATANSETIHEQARSLTLRIDADLDYCILNCSAAALTEQWKGETMGRELGVGEPAPKLELPTETGEIVSLESLRGRAVLVSFLSHAA